ncbi:unnamed protein product [Aphis gossypii]|uniref:Uncharacterized protein n=1 Tax=Aphis gossypii TaxID=80765 RepID=A0A9P0IPX1_APHGO|nr:unnamed protein product [Aphis gossypii]
MHLFCTLSTHQIYPPQKKQPFELTQTILFFYLQLLIISQQAFNYNYTLILFQWFTNWKIKINESKSSFVTFALRPHNYPPITINNTIIPHSNEVKYLSLIFDRRLTWSYQLKDRRKTLNSRPLLRLNLALPLKLIPYKTLIHSGCMG